MSTLRITLFGSISLSHPDWNPEIKITRSVKSLLAYLLLYRHRLHHREVLASLFWGDYREDRARSCLSTAIWRLRRVLDQAGKGTYIKATSMGEIGFNNESDYWLDVELFETLTAQVFKKPAENMAPLDAKQLENALSLYKGELLEGFYDDWALRERERLRAMYIKSLGHLMRYYGHHKAYEYAIPYGLQILNQDPLREEIHREVMRLYVESGNRTQAVRHYESCCRVLETELGVEPMEETQTLYARITEPTDRKKKNTMPFQKPSAIFLEESTTLKQIFLKIHLALDDIEMLKDKLQQVAQLSDRAKEMIMSADKK